MSEDVNIHHQQSIVLTFPSLPTACAKRIYDSSVDNGSMTIDSQTRDACSEVRALSAIIKRDLDGTVGGIGWWSGYDLTVVVRCGLSDYLIDAVDGVGAHLRAANLALKEYRRKRFSDDFKLRERMRKNGGSPIGRGRDISEDENSSLLLQSHVYAFFNRACSVLDTLAGTVIGVGALDRPLVRADLRDFHPVTFDPDYPAAKTKLRKSLASNAVAQELQLGLIRAFRSSLLQAGPPGWHTWLDQKRNQLAHRGGRLQLVAFPHRGRGPDAERVIVLERDPDLTTIQGFQGAGRTMEAMYLIEDELVTMNGLMQSLIATVVGTLVAAQQVWERRKSQPLLLKQPATQWHKPQCPSGFEGYEPDPALYKTVSSVLVNPDDAARLDSAQTFNQRTRAQEKTTK